MDRMAGDTTQMWSEVPGDVYSRLRGLEKNSNIPKKGGGKPEETTANWREKSAQSERTQNTSHWHEPPKDKTREVPRHKEMSKSDFAEAAGEGTGEGE